VHDHPLSLYLPPLQELHRGPHHPLPSKTSERILPVRSILPLSPSLWFLLSEKAEAAFMNLTFVWISPKNSASLYLLYCTFQSAGYQASSVCGWIHLTLQTSSDLCNPRNEIALPRSQFPHSCICELFIFPRSVHLFCFISGNICFEFSVQCVRSAVSYLPSPECFWLAGEQEGHLFKIASGLKKS
jgi:hypothetical protein